MRVPHAFKVRNRFVDSCHMVYENVGYFLAVLKYYSVYQNPDTRFDHIEDDFMVFFVRQRRHTHYENPVYPLGNKAAYIILDFTLGGAYADKIIIVDCRVFKSGYYLGKIRVGQIVRQNGELTRLVLCHRTRHHIRRIVQLLYRIPYLFGDFRRNAPAFIKNIGDRRLRNSGPSCHIFPCNPHSYSTFSKIILLYPPGQ